jgi:hypothetical protein
MSSSLIFFVAEPTSSAIADVADVPGFNAVSAAPYVRSPQAMFVFSFSFPFQTQIS